jgi:WXG100 family type VII secretion target
MSGADIISVNFAQLRAAADQLSAKANVLTGHMDALQRSLQPLKETWVASNSSAGQAAQQSENRLRQAIADIINVINQFSGKVHEATDLQQSLEQKNTSYFQ